MVEAKASVEAATTDLPRLLRGLRLLARAQSGAVYAFATQQGRVQVRGASQGPGRIDYRDAERMAWQLDAALLGAHMPVIGGVPTLGFNRSGGPPTPDEDAGNRPVMTCNYVVSAASAL